RPASHRALNPRVRGRVAPAPYPVPRNGSGGRVDDQDALWRERPVHQRRLAEAAAQAALDEGRTLAGEYWTRPRWRLSDPELAGLLAGEAAEAAAQRAANREAA